MSDKSGKEAAKETIAQVEKGGKGKNVAVAVPIANVAGSKQPVSVSSEALKVSERAAKFAFLWYEAHVM